MFQLGNLALSIQGMSESGAPSSMGSEGDEESPVFKKVGESEEQEGGEEQEEAAPAGDLFSEIHLGQLKKLEKQLDSSEVEKQHLSTNMKDIQSRLDGTLKDAALQKARVAELLAYVANLDKLTADENSRLYTRDNGTVEQHKTWQNKCVTELDALKENLKHFKVEDQQTFDSVTKLKNELSDMKEQMQNQEKTLSELSHDIKIMDSLSIESQTVLGQAQNELSNVTEELAKIYHHICTANNITPSRVMLEHSKGIYVLFTVSSIYRYRSKGTFFFYFENVLTFSLRPLQLA